MLDYLKQIAFGLDISSSTVSALKITRKGRRLALASFGASSLAPGLIRSGKIQDENFLSEIIRKTVLSSRPHIIRDLFVNLSLPEQATFLGIVQLPQMSRSDVKEAIKWEIEANIPFPIDSVYYDWQILKSFSVEKPNHLDILIVAVPKDILDSYIRVVKRAGFFPKTIEPDSFSLCRSVIPSFFSSEPVLVLELSSSQATLVIFSGNAPRFSSTIPVSGRYFAEIAAAEWNVAERVVFEKTGKTKKSSDEKLQSLSASEEKKEGVEVPIFSNFLTEQIRSYLEFYEGHAEHDHGKESGKINKIFLCGGGLFAGFDQFLKKKLKIEVVIADPFVNISKRPRVDFSSISIEKSLTLTKALALAAKDFLIHYD